MEEVGLIILFILFYLLIAALPVLSNILTQYFTTRFMTKKEIERKEQLETLALEFATIFISILHISKIKLKRADVKVFIKFLTNYLNGITRYE